MSRLPRCFYVGFQGLGDSHEPVLVPRCLLKLFLSDFDLSLLMLGCRLAPSPVRSPFLDSPLYSVLLWVLLCHLGVPVTTPETHQEQQSLVV